MISGEPMCNVRRRGKRWRKQKREREEREEEKTGGKRNKMKALCSRSK